MKNIKLKQMMLILFGFLISSFFIVGFVRADYDETVYLSTYPGDCWVSFGEELNHDTDIVIDIKANDIINIYVLDETENTLLEDTGEVPTDYIKRWINIEDLQYTYDIVLNILRPYYVCVYNMDPTNGRAVDVKITYNKQIFGYSFLLIGLTIGLIIIPLIFKLRKKIK